MEGKIKTYEEVMKDLEIENLRRQNALLKYKINSLRRVAIWNFMEELKKKQNMTSSK